jgi:hypothetical protein
MEPSVATHARARRLIYERLAFLTAAIWVVGTFLLFINIVPPTTDRPNIQIVISMMVPILPAAAPWLFYGSISNALARRWSRQSRVERPGRRE